MRSIIITSFKEIAILQNKRKKTRLSKDERLCDSFVSLYEDWISWKGNEKEMLITLRNYNSDSVNHTRLMYMLVHVTSGDATIARPGVCYYQVKLFPCRD